MRAAWSFLRRLLSSPIAAFGAIVLVGFVVMAKSAITASAAVNHAVPSRSACRNALSQKQPSAGSARTEPSTPWTSGRRR